MSPQVVQSARVASDANPVVQLTLAATTGEPSSKSTLHFKGDQKIVKLTTPHNSKAHPRSDTEVTESNARATASSAAILLGLFLIEIFTVVLGVNSFLTLHVFIGLLAAPVLLVKIYSVGRRFFGYYRGNTAFRKKGPPTPLLRVLGPALLLITAILFGSGLLILLAPSALGGNVHHIHSFSFYLWLLLVMIHIVAPFKDFRKFAPRDCTRRSTRTFPGVLKRRWVMVISLVVGLLVSISLISHVDSYRNYVRQQKSLELSHAQSHKFSISSIHIAVGSE